MLNIPAREMGGGRMQPLSALTTVPTGRVLGDTSDS